MSGSQGGDPAKLARALVQLASQAEPPLRWPAGADAVETFEKKARELLAQPTPTGCSRRRSRMTTLSRQMRSCDQPLRGSRPG
jgi:hypothetical protein